MARGHEQEEQTEGPLNLRNGTVSLAGVRDFNLGREIKAVGVSG